MDENQAFTLINNQIPETGDIDYAVVENALRSTSEGRQALRYFHKLRRAGKISVRVNRETAGLTISRAGLGG